MTDTNEAQDWRITHQQIRERLRRTEELQNSWRMYPPTLSDAAKSLCDADAPPPTQEELLWLKDKLIEHQNDVQKLIGLIEALLASRSE